MRYHDPDGSWRGRRPEGIPAENMETQLLESIEEESVGRDNEIEVLEPSVSHRTQSNISVIYESLKSIGPLSVRNNSVADSAGLSSFV